MGRKLHYRKGSFYRADDRTGFPQRAEDTRKQWNNLIVDQSVWEARQPQDLVKGVKDDQTVPEARPLGPNVYIGPIYAQITADLLVGTTFVPLVSTEWMTLDDEVGIMLFDGSLFITGIASILSNGIFIYQGLPAPVTSGSLLVDYRIPTRVGGPIMTEDFNFLTTEDGALLLQEN